ncbi:MAG TPA: peptide chain release factor N(5)-glutamine methyltransferase [Candidatus Saccharimonadales bacterium]|nr:peptide chain release factor N(5)-glutamine methyltransferase [Candidatus Saccharimonadales bacterium]
MTIGVFLQQQTKSLGVVGITTPRLDVLVLLSDQLKKDKSWILAHLDMPLNFFQHYKLRKQCKRRSKHVPLAYIRKKQQFYGRYFTVTPDVLIPRPESETIIEIVKKYSPASLLDVGTGSGCIAITAKLELPACAVAASDISQQALNIAAGNNCSLGTDVDFWKSDLLSKVPGKFDMIVANLPYVDRSWERSPETRVEPKIALFASNGGLDIIYKLLLQAPRRLTKQGLLVLEADPRQHAAIIKAAKPHFGHVSTDGFIVVLRAL